MYKFRAVGQDLQTLPTSNPYCENLLPNMCLKEQRVLDKAKEDCWTQEHRGQTRGLFGSLGRTCTLYASDAKVGMSQYNLWDPCMLAKLPLCGGTPTTTTTSTPDTTPIPVTVPQPDEPTEERDDESDSGQFMVGGILGLLVLGGIGYAVFKNRKKKKKGKRR